MFNLASDDKVNSTSLQPNGEQECRNYCQELAYYFSVLVESSKCFCINNYIINVTAKSVNNNYCNMSCTGQKNQFCGGTPVNTSWSWLGAFYFTIGKN